MVYFLCLGSVGEIQSLQSGVCHRRTGTSCDESNRGSIKRELCSRQLLSDEIRRTDSIIFLSHRKRLVPNKSAPVKLEEKKARFRHGFIVKILIIFFTHSIEVVSNY